MWLCSGPTHTHTHLGTLPPPQVAAAAELVSSVSLSSDFPYQLRDNINNPSLARHFDMLEVRGLTSGGRF